MIILYCKARHVPRRSSSRRRGKSKTRSKAPVALWLLIGLFFGMLGTIIAYAFLNQEWPLAKPNTEINQKLLLRNTTLENASTPSRKTNLAQKKAAHHRFEFYRLLPGMEVPIPEEDLPRSQNIPKLAAPLATKSITAPKSSVPSSTVAAGMPPSSRPLKSLPPSKAKLAKVQTKLAAAQYLIQVNAYRTLPAAESLQSRLTLQGFKARIQKIAMEDGIWFRVIVGPFPSETMALHQKNRLSKQQIHGILILQRQ